MHRHIIAALSITLIATSAAAQTWAEQQQMYNDKANLESELFHQREEMERMRQENARALEEQRRELELQRLDSQRQSSTYRFNESNVPSTSTRSLNSKQDVADALRDAENKAFVMREEPKSIIKFNEAAHAKLMAALERQGAYLKPYQSENLRYAWKAMWLRKVQAAQQGNAVAQRELGIALLAEDDIQRDYKQAVKWFRLAAKQGDDEAFAYLERMAELPL